MTRAYYRFQVVKAGYGVLCVALLLLGTGWGVWPVGILM